MVMSAVKGWKSCIDAMVKTKFRDNLVKVGDAVLSDPLKASGSRKPCTINRALARGVPSEFKSIWC